MAADPIKRQYIMLKPMATGANGFARLEEQTNRVLLQLTCKDLKDLARALRVFLYADEGALKELGHTPVNPQGQAALTIDLPWREFSLSPSRLQAILIVSDDPTPTPLLLGLCAQQSAGSLMDAKNAMLALCEKLSRASQRISISEPAVPPSPPPPEELPSKPLKPPPVLRTSRRTLSTATEDPTPQEVFLAAIDPRDYIAKSENRSSSPLSTKPTSPSTLPREEAREPDPIEPPRPRRESTAPPIDRLRPLVWAPRLRDLPSYFERYPSVAPFVLPGWRFVRVPMARGGSFVIGRYAMDGRITRIAYAVPGLPTQPPPKQLARYRFQEGRDGQGYWTLWQEVK